MKKIASILVCFISTVAFCQNPPYRAEAAYVSPSDGVWNPWTASAGFGSLNFDPYKISLYCQSADGQPWQPCNPSSGGGTTTNPLTINSSGSGAASPVTFDGSAGKTISYNTIGAAPSTNIALSALAAQAADTIVQNATGGSAAPTAVAMPTCTTGADLYNTATHTWSCVSLGSSGNYVNIGGSVTWSGCTYANGSCTVVTPGSSITVSSIPGTYVNLRPIVMGASTASASFDDFLMQFNGDTTSGHYTWQYIAGNATITSAGSANGTSLDIGGFGAANATNMPGEADILIPFYASTAFNKSYIDTNGRAANNGGTAWGSFVWNGGWLSTAAITSIKFFPSAGPNFATGTQISLYATN